MTSSSNQGLLVPRLTTTQRLSLLLTASSNGLLLYDIDSNRFCFYNVGPPPMTPHWDMISSFDDLQTMQIWNSSGGNIYYSLGNVGIGTTTPQTPLHVATGDVYIENIGSGVIMKSPNGNCWRMTVNNSGNPVFTQITCP